MENNLQEWIVWWDNLLPSDKQDLADKYFPENMFGALSVDEEDILFMYNKEKTK